MAGFQSGSQAISSNNFHAQSVSISHAVHQAQTVLPRRDPTEIFLDNVAFGALYNSRERFDPPKCHPQTRTAVLDHIAQWAADTSIDAKPILWLSGPAGAGKSAIAQTLVEEWKEKDILTVAFFFWRSSPERNQITRLVPTIAINATINAAISAGGLFERNLTFQLDKLLLKPLLEVEMPQQHPLVIVIDGLDECCVDLPIQDYESQQREVLEVFGSACQRTPFLKLLIASRPERQIRESFGDEFLERFTVSVSLKNIENAFADISLFLNCKFQEIRRRRGIGQSWPTEFQLSELVRKSSGQFIYPSIAVKYIMRARANPRRSLQAVLELQPGSVDNPLAELDMLYTLVLKSVSPESLPVVTDIFAYLLAWKNESHFDYRLFRIFRPCPIEESLLMFEKFFFLPEGEADSHFTDLHSVMDIPSPDSLNPISFIHATFPEYLQDESRSGGFSISEERIFVHCTLVLFKHLEYWSLHTENHMYDFDWLIRCTCYWIDGCPPSRRLMVQLWRLMRAEIGSSPFVDDDPGSETANPISEELSTLFVSEIKRLETLWMRELLIYLQRCNTPEIEPSCQRRSLAHQRLTAALLKYPDEYENLIGPRSHWSHSLLNDVEPDQKTDQ